ncbi:hypothetical protein FRB90_007263, partial [Tulasnella sp. 427]
MATSSSQFHLDVPAAAPSSSDAVPPSRSTSPPRQQQHAKRPSLSRQSTSNRSQLGVNYPASLGSGHPSSSNVNVNVNVRRLPFSSDESLILQLGGAARSFSMPVPEHVLLQQERQDEPSPAPASSSRNTSHPSRPLYVRGNTTITGSSGLNVMSDDEGEKKTFQPVMSRTSADESSVRDRVVSSQTRDDRADKVRSMVESMTRKCSEQEKHIRSLEVMFSLRGAAAVELTGNGNIQWLLEGELARSRELSKDITDSSQRLENRKRGLQDLTSVSLPSMSRKLAQAKRESESAKSKLPKVETQLDSAETEFELYRKKALALHKHFLWRMTPWWKKVFAYVTGKVELNWSDHSLHRRHSISTALSWGAVVLAVLAVAVAT